MNCWSKTSTAVHKLHCYKLKVKYVDAIGPNHVTFTKMH